MLGRWLEDIRDFEKVYAAIGGPTAGSVLFRGLEGGAQRQIVKRGDERS